MTKRWLAFLTVMCLMLTSVPFTVSAAAQTWDFLTLEGYYKTQGRVALNGTALEMDTTSSGFEFYFEGSGDVTLSADVRCSYSTDLYLSVIVDGVTTRTCVDAGVKSSTVSKTLTLATGLSYGIHHIEVYKQSEAIVSLMKANSITFNGTPLATAPFDKITIEVIGDSLSSGASMWSSASDQSIPQDYPVFLDGTKTYAYVAGEAVGANVRVTQASGYGCVEGFNSDGLNLQDLYPYTNYWRSSTALYDFDPPADIVVINLATNDGMCGTVTDDEFKAGALNLLDLAIANNPNAQVVWCMGMMGTYFESAIQEALAEKGGAESGFYYCALPYGGSGGYSHPNVAEHAAAAAVLEAFLLENCLPEEYLSDFASADDLSAALTKANAVADPSATLQTAMTFAQAELDFGTADEYRLGCRLAALNDALAGEGAVDLMPKKSTAECPIESNGSYIWPYFGAEDGSVALYKGGEGYYWPKIETLTAPMTVNVEDMPYLCICGNGTAYFNIHLEYKDGDGNPQIVTASTLAGNGDVDFSPGELNMRLDLGGYIAENGHADANGNIVLTSCYLYASGEMDVYVKLYACEITENDGSYVPTAISGNYPIVDGILYDVDAATTVEELLSNMNDASYLSVLTADGQTVSGTVATGMILRLSVNGNTVQEVTVAVNGDVNADGAVNTVDCRKVLMSTLDGTVLTDVEIRAADRNGDNQATSSDVRAMLMMCLGI